MHKYILILISILTLSCNSSDEDILIAGIESSLISQDNLYGNGSEGIVAQNLVISDQSTWNNLMTQMNSVNNVSENFAETTIDFSKYKVIAVFSELKSNGGHRLELDITSNSEKITVGVRTISPTGNAITVITQPYHIVKITTSELPIVFE